MSVRYEADGPVAVVTIDRPEVRNAVDRATAAELAAAFRGSMPIPTCRSRC